MIKLRRVLVFLFILTVFAGESFAQGLEWTADGNGYIHFVKGAMIRTDIATSKDVELVSASQLTAPGADKPLEVDAYEYSSDGKNLLLFANTARVWRYNTRGDYWIMDLQTHELHQIGKDRPSQTLMFAKFSPDGKKVGYVSEKNIYVEDVATAVVTQITTDGKDKLINGTFDWVYEEEFDCRDGFRWSPDSKTIAYWQVDASKIGEYLMLNTTDSNYSFTVPVEYPKVGTRPSPVRIGVIPATGGKTTWMQIPGEPDNNYLPRMTWTVNPGQLLIQQMNRKQNETKLYLCEASTGASNVIYEEQAKAWIDANMDWKSNEPASQKWLKGGKEFVWVSEKDGWRHIYRESVDGKQETLVTNGDYDIGSIACVDEKNNVVYFTSTTPDNATQVYLYKTKLDGKGKAERVTPDGFPGSHMYTVSPNGKFAMHTYSSHEVPPVREWVSLPAHKPLDPSKSIAKNMKKVETNVKFLKLTTDDGITVDAWMAYPDNFDSTKVYPVLMSVYGEPASSTVMDRWGTGRNGLYNGDMAKDGYFYVSVDNRGTPMLKGAAWRKAIYRNIGTINIRDQAMAMQKMLQSFPFLDTSRVAVHGWSGGGSSTLNLLFKYPQIFGTGIAVAAVANQLFYDNIYQERYMGLPQENMEDFVRGSPVNHAQNLSGNLLYIHGSGDDNVQYDNAEVLLNALIKYNKVFQFMEYPNRSHGIFEGEGTRKHLNTLFTSYLRAHCPPGPRDPNATNNTDTKKAF